MSLLILSADDSRRVVDTFEPIKLELCMARVFHIYSRRNTPSTELPTTHTDQPPSIVMPHRSSISSPHYTTLFMPAFISNTNEPAQADARSPQDSLTAIKIVSIPRTPSGLPATTVLLDGKTGVARAIINARMLTAVRNAAGSLVSTVLYGPRRPSNLVAFGAGLQIQLHVLFFLRRFPSIKTCTIVNRTLNDRASALLTKLNDKFPNVNTDFIASDTSDQQDTVKSRVRNADIIICATSSTIPLFPSTWVRDRTHIILIGSYTPSMREVDTDLVKRAILSPPKNSALATDLPPSPGPKRAPVLVVDSIDACLKEAGELLDAAVAPSELTELGTVIDGSRLGDLATWRDVAERDDVGVPVGDERPLSFDGPVTMFKSVGLGIQDVAIASAVVQKALELGNVGTTINGYDC